MGPGFARALFANPKSSTLIVPSGRSLILAGLRSRWMMPCSCAASSASAIWRAMASASSRGNGPAREARGEVLAVDELHDERARSFALLETVDMRDVRVIERGERLGLALETRRPFAVDLDALRAGSSARPHDSSLVSRARYTSPMPPAPIEASTS